MACIVIGQSFEARQDWEGASNLASGGAKFGFSPAPQAPHFGVAPLFVFEVEPFEWTWALAAHIFTRM